MMRGSLIGCSSALAVYLANVPKLSPMTAGAVAFLLYSTKRIDDSVRALSRRVDALVAGLASDPVVAVAVPEEILPSDSESA